MLLGSVYCRKFICVYSNVFQYFDKIMILEEYVLITKASIKFNYLINNIL